MALQAPGGEALHASGVVGPSGVVALCGESGAGKSTLAWALSARGHLIWADDAVAFEIGGAGVVAVPLPFRINARSVGVCPYAVSKEEWRCASRSSRATATGPGDAGRRERMVSAYLELVARVPVIEVRFEPGCEHVDVLVDALEEIVTRR